MPHFRYRAVTASGELVTGEVEAPSRQEVVRRIEYLGHLTIEAELIATGVLSPAGVRQGSKTPRPREVTIFVRQLALLVGAGLTLEVALQTLGEDAGTALAGFVGSIRSSIVSIEPNIIVAVVGMPSCWASRITPSHASGCTFRAEIRLRTRSTRISAPAPGSDFIPAAFKRANTSRVGSFSTCDKPTISETESE